MSEPVRFSLQKSFINGGLLVRDEDGGWVQHRDYQQLSDYADHLASFAKLPCLPKDLENLREANGNFATQVHNLIKDNERLNKLVSYYSSRLSAREADLRAIKAIIQ